MAHDWAPMPYDPKLLEEHKERMTRGEDLVVTLLTHYGKKSEGHLRHIFLSPQEADAPARKWLVRCLILAPFLFILPPHFPWLLAAIATGVGGYYLRRGHREQILTGEANCPQCGAFQIIEGGNAEYPMAHFCTECRERSLIEPVK